MTYFSVDLHTHTTASDGVLTPTQLVERAAERGLKAIGIADHDTIGGVLEAQAAGQRLGVEVVAGIEFSTRHEDAKQFTGLHILGYFINPHDATLIDIVNRVQQSRVDQKVAQIEKLQSFGFDIPVEAVFEQVGGVPGRPHIASVLMERNPGRFENFQQIFDEYLGVYKKAHIRRDFALTVGQAIDVIKQAGGLPVFAHPAVYREKIDVVTAVRNAHAEGMEGLEVQYPYYIDPLYSPATRSRWISRMNALADELGLLKSGGTDFHGRPGETIDIGEMGLTMKQYQELKAGWQNLRRVNNF